jgi:hypothetical protein
MRWVLEKAWSTGEVSFARPKVSMAAFNEERVQSHPFGCWGSVATVETPGGHRETVRPAAMRKSPNLVGSVSGHRCHAAKVSVG